MDQTSIILTLVFAIGFPALFAGIYFLVCKLISLRGWQGYANRYTGQADFPADFTWQSLMIGGNIAPANYQFVATGAVNDDGIFLKMGPFFKAFHPPLFIPWSAIDSIEQKKAIKGVYTAITCADLPRLVLFRKFGDAVFAKWQIVHNNGNTEK
ncbi:MAG: hypothetical protein Pars2KO_22850 [Parasphingorhabdus sp.]